LPKVILLVLTIEDGENLSYFSKCSLAVGIPFQMLASLVGWIAMRTEQLLLVWCFLPLCCAEPVFIAYRITQVNENQMSKIAKSSPVIKVKFLFLVFSKMELLYR
jgi:hypothetical protein